MDDEPDLMLENAMSASPTPDHRPERPAVAHPARERHRTTAQQRNTSGPEPAPIAAAPPTSPVTASALGNHDSDRFGGWEIADLVAAGILDVVPGHPPVPVSIWRTSGPPEPAASPPTLYQGLTPKLAARLLAIYTDPGQTVLDATSDPAVAGAAGAGARRYLNIDLVQARLMPDLRRQASLILLRWPTTRAQDRTNQEPNPHPDLAACADLLGAEGHTVVILAPPPAGAYRDHARTLIPAASRAGLGYLQHLLVITMPIDEPPSTPAAEPACADPENGAATMARGRTQAHLDLLVFIFRHGVRA